ncbi:MAG: chromosomal replication initiator protein DnaA, partial [Actinomycetota bacterium]
KSTEPVAIHEGSFIISTPNKFTKEWIESRHLGLIKAALQETGGPELDVLDVRVTVRREQAAPLPGPLAAGPLAEQSAGGQATNGGGRASAPFSVQAAGARPARTSQFNSRYVFDTFVVGESNRFAHAASVAVSENPAKAYNPLFIYGGAGLGKTHLLHAIGLHVSSLRPDLRVEYITTETFTNEFIYSIRQKTPLPFQKKYRDADLMLIDDIQFITNKVQTQEEFFHTFNTLYEAHKQVVISSDRPPKEMPTLEDRLRSRFEWGLIVDIQPPDLETRIAILQKKAELAGIAVADDVIHFIAEKRQHNIRELEGALTRVAAFADLTNSVIDVSLAKDILKEIFPEVKPKKITSRSVVNETAKYFGLTVAELTGRGRSRHIVYPRQVGMYLCRDLTDFSLPKIGEVFGGRDHTTAIHAISKITTLAKKDQEIRTQLQDLANRIRQRDA